MVERKGGRQRAQITGNVGLYRVCAELSKLGFNVMPTARNAKGVDVVGYDGKGNSFTVQVKTLTKTAAVPLGQGTGHLTADYFVLVVLEGKGKAFSVWTRKEMRKVKLWSNVGQDGKKSTWFNSKTWTRDAKAADAWHKVKGNGND
jgi:hypothetical protein